MISAAENGDCWRVVAEANGVPTSTAYGWIIRSDDPPMRRGGVMKNHTPRHIEKMLYVEENPLIISSRRKPSCIDDYCEMCIII